MSIYLYLSLTPESLIASMLTPEEFGKYLAVGTRKRSSGSAIYFSIKDGFSCDHFDIAGAEKRCIPHPDGEPKHSVYLGAYRVLEHVPMEFLGDLYLVTRDGRVLKLEQGEMKSSASAKFHLFKELCPVHPLIASTMDAREFCRLITDPTESIHFPRVCVVEQDLAGLADDPKSGKGESLPYSNMEHIRDCLSDLEGKGKAIKTVDRIHPLELHYRCIKNGFYVGDQNGVVTYPFPPVEALERDHHNWWRSANV